MEKIALFSFVSLFVILTVKKYSPEYSVFIALAAGCAVMIFSMDNVSEVISLLGEYSREANVNTYMMNILIKSISCAYLAQFASDICRDAGENSLASKIETAAKIVIGTMSLPVMINMFEYLREMLVKI
ncbi:MAG: stage III sporulation protein AD [Eubacteriaceae bacterium]|nr:stage III sporulation protein AD [Eubacteriaceae bacterium]